MQKFVLTTGMLALVFGDIGVVRGDYKKEITQGILAPSAQLVNELYCSKRPMVAGSVRAKVDYEWSHNREAILSTFNSLISHPGPVLQVRLWQFFQSAQKGLEVDQSVIAKNSAHNCADDWRDNACYNLFPHYNALNLAVMTHILAENRKLLNKTHMSTCAFAAEHAQK